MDGDNIKDLHLGWLRSQIGIVSQEPVLFNTTILENVQYGREGVTLQEVEDACRQSNAHGFISKLPNVRMRQTMTLMNLDKILAHCPLGIQHHCWGSWSPAFRRAKTKDSNCKEFGSVSLDLKSLQSDPWADL